VTAAVTSGGVLRFALALRTRDDDQGLEPFYADLLAGMEEELDRHGATVLAQIVPDVDAEIVAYRRWVAQRLVSCVVITNLVEGDPREGVCAELGLPAVLLGGDPGTGGWVVEYDNAGVMRTAVDFLVGLGHRTLGRVTGPECYRHTRVRNAAFRAATAAQGVAGTDVVGDYGAASGREGTALLLAEDPRPTAILYDNDVMAVAGLAEVQRRGLRVPDDLSLLAWDDSALCRVAHPSLSAVSRDVHELGAVTAQLLLRAATGTAPGVELTPGAAVVARASTAPPGSVT
jgi:DNA-binding LacI/PurR family transcriptional regulator